MLPVPAERDTTQRDRSRLKGTVRRGDESREIERTKRNETKRSEKSVGKREKRNNFFPLSFSYLATTLRTGESEERRRRINEKSITVVGGEKRLTEERRKKESMGARKRENGAEASNRDREPAVYVG